MAWEAGTDCCLLGRATTALQLSVVGHHGIAAADRPKHSSTPLLGLLG